MLDLYLAKSRLLVRNIRFTYQTHDATLPVTFELSPSEYYDPLESDAESYDVDGVPKYLSPHEYLSVRPDDLKFLIIQEPTSSGTRELRIQYLDGLRSHCIHSIWPDSTEELIHSTDIGADMYHIVRTEKNLDGYWSVILNTIGHHRDEAPIVDRCGRYNYKQLRVFWDTGFRHEVK